MSSRGSAVDDFEEVGRIDAGMVVLVGATHDDTESSADALVAKLVGLRIFDDADGVMNVGAADAGAEFLIVSQFTLYGDTSRGRRPSWIAAARPEQAEPLVDRVVAGVRSSGARVATGRFRTEMRVDLVNDGPVTLIIET